MDSITTFRRCPLALHSDENQTTEAISIRRKHFRPILTGSYGSRVQRTSCENPDGGFSEPDGADDEMDGSPAPVPPTPLNSVVVESDVFIASLAVSNVPPQAIERLLEGAVSLFK
ncbi:unnamed protein product [Hymenolepis diminuta]|uniref:Uncharacterized protein n=1 Tax=Hymenolepis diminuta TaxID=6216 RepID=A0A0R3SM69_HYMDI|nr:unnamed protein product [Hymenolepis diminuta]